MARKLPSLQRMLGAPSLFAVAYGEIASSIYFALGVVASRALGLTPALLVVAGLLFLLVALSYAEGTAAIPEAGGGATLVRKAFNDLAGFLTGWALFLDYLIVIALAALFLPHYLGGALQLEPLGQRPWDVVVAVGVIAGLGLARLLRRPGFYAAGVIVSVLDLGTQLLLSVLGFAFLFSPQALAAGIDLGRSPSWSDLAFALPLAMLAYTGLETVANLAEEARRPGSDLPRSLFGAVGVVLLLYTAIALVGLSAFPPQRGESELGTTWLEAPLLGIVASLAGPLPPGLDHLLRLFVGLSGGLILLAAAATSLSGFGRLAYSLGEHGMLPRAFGRLDHRTLVPPQSIAAACLISSAILVAVAAAAEEDVVLLAGLYSFGVLLAFAAAQAAVVRLRLRAPDLLRPYRVPLSVSLGGVCWPLPSLLGCAAVLAVWVAALVTHPGARYAGLAWMAAGLLVYALVRRRRGEGLMERVVAPDERPLAEPAPARILVPLKLGLIGEEMLATAVKLAQERGAAVEALHVIRVPFDKPLDAPLPEHEQRAREALAEAQELGREQGVEVRGRVVRARAIGEAIVEEAKRASADLIVLGSAPRWRRQSRFFSPTVEYVLRRAPCEVLVVAFPASVLAEEAALEGAEQG